MKFVKKTAAVVAAAMLIGSPVAAQSSLSLAKPAASKAKRVGTVAKKEDKFGGNNGVIVGVLAAVAVIVGIILISGDDSPSSP